MENKPVPPNIRIWQLGLGFANSNVMIALVKTGVIEQLRETPKTLEQLSSECKLHSNMLFRTLRFAAAIEIISLDNDRYSLTETGRLMLKDVPGSVYGGLTLFGFEPWQKSWNNLVHSLVTGEPAFNNANGSSLWEFLDHHPEYGLAFDQWMTTLSTMISKIIPEAYDFSDCNTVCDIGGGQGLLLKGILTANPDLSGILFDLETVVKNNLLDDFSARVKIIAGSFFESVPSADVIIMKTIIHDWDDQKSLLILNSCKKSMRTGTKLLLIERVIENNNDYSGFFYDLHMQVMVGGKERSENEFKILFEKAGLKLNRIIPTKSPLKIIEVTL